MEVLEKIQQKSVWLSPKLRKCRSVIKWKRQLLHEEYDICAGSSYANRILLDAEDGNEELSRLISNGGGYCAGKLGDVELFNVLDRLITGNPGKRNRWRLQNNAGFFTCVEGNQEYQQFCDLYLKAV